MGTMFISYLHHSTDLLYRAKALSVRAQKETKYKIRITYGGQNQITSILKGWLAGQKAMLVTTPTVNNLYGKAIAKALQNAGIDLSLKELDCTEESKTLSQAERVCAWAQEVGIDRKGVLVSLGGGVCMDIVTVAASLIHRGIKYLRVPTTLIGLVDAGIGIKGAVNFGNAKNYLGCYSPPSKVLIAPLFLRTLSEERLREGFAEILKIALVRDGALFELIENDGLALIDSRFEDLSVSAKLILQYSIFTMIDELKSNIYEDQTYERSVDFGHTFSPTIEVETQYKLSHGQAVSIDIALSTVLAHHFGLIQIEYRDRILSLMKRLGLPIYTRKLTATLCKKSLLRASSYRGGHPNLVLPTDKGKSYFVKDAALIDDEILDESIRVLAEVDE
jgi:3-dehydroquinate synthetase